MAALVIIWSVVKPIERWLPPLRIYAVFTTSFQIVVVIVTYAIHSVEIGKVHLDIGVDLNFIIAVFLFSFLPLGGLLPRCQTYHFNYNYY